MYESLADFEKALQWLIQKNAPSADFLVYLDFEHTSRRTGHFSFVLEYWDGSILFAKAQAELLPQGEVSLTYYRFQYQLDGKTIFRYDDAPHFPHHHTFPHHKQIGEHEVAYPCYAPTIEEVLQEIEAILASEVPGVPTVI
jgi:hypothetical protein